MKNVVQRENIGFHRCKLPASFSQTCARGKGWGTFGCCLCADNFESCTPIVPNARFKKTLQKTHKLLHISWYADPGHSSDGTERIIKNTNFHKWKMWCSEKTLVFIDVNCWPLLVKRVPAEKVEALLVCSLWKNYGMCKSYWVSNDFS